MSSELWGITKLNAESLTVKGVDAESSEEAKLLETLENTFLGVLKELDEVKSLKGLSGLGIYQPKKSSIDHKI